MTTDALPAHSDTVGGSTAARVLACPASVRLVQRMPPQPSTDYAAEGTALHACMEHLIREGVTSDDWDDLRQLVGQTFEGIEITQELVDKAVVPALRMFDEYFARLEEEDGEVLNYALETTVHLPKIEGAFGHADVLMVTPKRAAVWDWKFGAGVPVSAVENKQLMFYARAAAHTAKKFFWFTGGADGAVDEWPVDLVVCQPLIDPDKPSIWPTDFGALNGFLDDLGAAMVEAGRDDPSYARGEHCRWCGAKPVCPQYKAVAQKLMALHPDALGKTPAKDVVLPVPPFEEFTRKDLRDWMQMADIVSTWAKSISALAMDEAQAGRPPKGHKLVEALSNTSYVEQDPGVIDKVLARRGLSIDERRKPWVPVSPTQAVAKLKKIGKSLPKDYTERRISGVSLVPNDDKRPAVRSVAERAAEAGKKLAAE